jgi:glycosyltransferase involved in cell wall biosynthesis
LEIVVVNDNSANDTLSFIQSLQIEDERIKLINNKKNMGTLYTRTIGTLSSKGKYIFPFDSDDMFLDKDVFYSVIKVAEKGDFDIVLFEMMISSLIPNAYHSSYKKTIFKKERIPNLVLYQPELSYFPFQSKDGNLNLVEVILNGRCIKTKIYKQALNKLGEERYSRYMTVDADIILNFIIFNTANSMKYIKKYGYIWVDRRDSTSHTVMSDGPQLLLYRIYMLDVLIEMSKNTERHKKLSAVLLSRILFSRHLEKALKKNEYNYNLFISCINRILNSSYISNNKKNEIKGKVKTLSFIKNKF